MKGVSSPILNSEEPWIPSRSSAHPYILPKRRVFESSIGSGVEFLGYPELAR